jgi:Asp-tRNA(Asn)/Glu-tRNA(Gln) amidotransferase A subunit family amidase
VPAGRNPHLISFSRALPEFRSRHPHAARVPRALVDAIASATGDQGVRHRRTSRRAQERGRLDSRYKSGQPLSPIDGCPIAIKTHCHGGHADADEFADLQKLAVEA